MRLLYDHNLSPKLTTILQDVYPQSVHVYSIGLEESSDVVIWEYARTNGLVIVTKDADYLAISAQLGHPPKVVRIGLGNGPTVVVAESLRFHHHELLRFFEDQGSAFIELR